MILRDIIEDADLLVPNAFSVEQKVKWVNQTQSVLFRDYPLWNAVHAFPVVSGTNTYSLPADCRQDQIELLLVGMSDYAYDDIGGPTGVRTFSFLEGKIVLNPTPNRDTEGKLYYKPAMVDLTTADLEKVPVFPVDFQELLVLGCAYRMAQRLQNFDLSTQLELRFEKLAREAERKTTKPKQKRIRAVRSWI